MPTNYKSDFERKVAAKLRRHRPGQFKYEIEKLPYVIEKDYIPDFTNNRTGMIVEVKGYLDSEDCRKMLAVKKNHPDRIILFVFMKPHQRLPKRKYTHAQWATKHNFLWTSFDDLHTKL